MSDGAEPKKKKTGLIIGVGVLLLLLIVAGTVVGLAVTGKIFIPGLSKKKVTKPAPSKKVIKPSRSPSIPIAAKKKVVLNTVPTENPTQGAKKLALVWNEMPPEKLQAVIAQWNPAQAGRVLNEMDSEKAAGVLSLMDPKKASLISLQMQILASKKDMAETTN
jgi:hypothetical protein